MRHPEKPNSNTTEDGRHQGLQAGKWCLVGAVSAGEDEKVLEMHGGNGCQKVNASLCTEHQKDGFILFLFYHD